MKIGWVGAGALVVGTLMVVNGSSPGASKKAGDNATETITAAAPPVYATASSGLQILGGLAQQMLATLSQALPPQQQPATSDTLPAQQRP